MHIGYCGNSKNQDDQDVVRKAKKSQEKGRGLDVLQCFALQRAVAFLERVLFG
jgi:cellobiose phosphorylase